MGRRKKVGKLKTYVGKASDGHTNVIQDWNCQARLTVPMKRLATSKKHVLGNSVQFGYQLHVVVDVKLVKNRNCEKSSEKAMTKLERLYSSKEGTAVNAATL